MMTAEENDLLARVGPEDPMGQLMRRHWVPILLSEEVRERDGRPLRARALGENFVGFRDSEGSLGVVDEVGRQRHVSRVYGGDEECGLRCRYSGWKYKVESNSAGSSLQ